MTDTAVLARPDPNHTAVWKPTRPDFTITLLRATSTNRGYHESLYEIISQVVLDQEDFGRLAACGLLGSGQSWHLELGGRGDETDVVDHVPAVMVDRRTGQVLPGPAVNWQGQPLMNLFAYTYHRYLIRRICDSGD